jgi:lipopolysaccharide/colanic/teichoic acid biosynthesis glycosyltransferase
MPVQAGKIVSARASWWSRVRVQLGVGAVVAVLMPWATRVQFATNDQDMVGLSTSVVGTLLGLIGGYYSFRRLSRYPGVRASYHILPTFAASYGLVLAVFFFARLDYSRLQFLASFSLCVLWYYVVYFKLQRQKSLRIGIVPGGDVEMLIEIDTVSWTRLSDHTAPTSGFDAIVADLRADIPAHWERFLADRALEGTLVMHVKQMQESLTGRVAIEHLSENNLGSLIPGVVYAKVKRVWDIGFTVLLLPFLLPFLFLVGVAVRLDSPGPALFRQQRMGYRGNSFRMFKFRSMAHQPNNQEDPRQASITQDDDHRVTRLGKYLRRYRVDELPQIINILKGEMSWIGPRPEAVPLSLWYEAELPFYRYRHIVRPGITGWAQVKQGHVAHVDDVLWKLQYDFYYIKNFSFWLDILILAGTVRTVFSGFGAR